MMTDLDPARVEPLLRGLALGVPYRFVDTTGSTNDDARALAAAGAPEGTVVVADQQTAGRGRLGRAWHSPPGVNLHLSVVLRPPGPPARLTGLPLAVAVALAEALEPLVPVRVALRWPNDVLLGAARRKVAGVLLELESEAGAVRQVVAGIGVDVNLADEELPAELRPLATSLRAVRPGRAPLDRAQVLAAVLRRLAARYADYRRAGLDPLRPAWRARAPLLGHTIDIADGTAGPRWSAVAEDIDTDGALRLCLPAGARRRLVSGEVHAARASSRIAET